MDARGWWMHGEYEPRRVSRSEKKKVVVRVLFRNRSNRCRDVGMTHLALSFLFSFSLSFFNQLFPLFSGRVSLAEPGALTSPLSGLSYGRHYRRAHASISHSRSSEPRLSESLRERAITPRASVAYTTIFFRSEILLRRSVLF